MLRMWSRALTAADLKDAPTDDAKPLYAFCELREARSIAVVMPPA